MKKWDVFISHASEDKNEVALPLMNFLKSKGIKVWLDLVELEIGDSLYEKIEEGLSNSTFGVVILSKVFFKKRWAKRELSGLFSLEENDENRILPIWHKIEKKEIAKHSPILSDRLAVSTDNGIDFVGESIAKILQKNSIKELEYKKFGKKMLSLNNSPSIYVLVYCIVKENITSFEQIFPIGNSDELDGIPILSKDHHLKYKDSNFIKYGIGGGFKSGIKRLLSMRILIGDIEDFNINPDCKNDLIRFLKINENIINQMTEKSKAQNANLQFYREETPNSIFELAKKIEI